jgi:nitroreductase
MDIYEALYTTRAMRRVTTEPIPMDVQAKILDAAIRAPSGGNQQNWAFMLVDEPTIKAGLATLYRQCIDRLWETIYKDLRAEAEADPEAPGSAATLRMVRSVESAADNFADYPLFLFGFNKGDNSGGSIFPAIWSAQLAARAEGVGSSLTTVLGFTGDAVPNLLGVPAGDGWSMSCCVPMGYPKGKWGVASRRPVHEVSYRNQWGTPVGFEAQEPLWSAD